MINKIITVLSLVLIGSIIVSSVYFSVKSRNMYIELFNKLPLYEECDVRIHANKTDISVFILGLDAGSFCDRLYDSQVRYLANYSNLYENQVYVKKDEGSLGNDVYCKKLFINNYIYAYVESNNYSDGNEFCAALMR